jgi:hypothetical protein
MTPAWFGLLIYRYANRGNVGCLRVYRLQPARQNRIPGLHSGQLRTGRRQSVGRVAGAEIIRSPGINMQASAGFAGPAHAFSPVHPAAVFALYRDVKMEYQDQDR